MSGRQYLYIFSNPSMPGMLKVGSTTRPPHERKLELHSTGVPTPFEIEYVFVVADCSACEQLAHRALHAYRVSTNREFFSVSIKTALKKIQAVIGPYKEFALEGKRAARLNAPASSKPDRSVPVKNPSTGKVVQPKTVVAPAEWPFPCRSECAEAKKVPSKPVAKPNKVKSKSAKSKTVIAPTAWPFPTSTRP